MNWFSDIRKELPQCPVMQKRTPCRNGAISYWRFSWARSASVLTQHVVRPSDCIRPVLHIVPLPSHVRRSRSLRIRHGVHEPADAGSNGQSGIQGRRLGERNARQRKSVSSWTAAPHVLQVVPRLRNIGRNRPRHGGPDLGQQWNPDKHVHDHLSSDALEMVWFGARRA